MIRQPSKLILKLLGWEIENKPPPLDKYIIIGAYHTSNWDFPLTLPVLSSLNIKFKWIGKHTLFRPPFGFLFRAIGGLPVDRNIHTGFISKMVDLYNSSTQLVIAISPEGTRSRKQYWKSGFYYIALHANIPVAPGYIDYANKKIGIGKYFTPPGNIEQDLLIIKEFYKDIKGKFPHKQSKIDINTHR